MIGGIPRWLRVLAVLLAILLAGASALADSIEVRLNASTKVYQSASTSARSVKLSKGLRLSLKAYAKGWGKVSYKGRIGYIRLKYLDRVHPLKAYVTKSTAIYRDSSGSSRLATASTGTAVYMIGVDGGYIRVQNGSGTQKGYISADALSASKISRASGENSGSAASAALPDSMAATPEGATQSRIEKTIYVAQKLIGAPYSNKARPPKTFDCANFCYYCYGNAGSSSLKGTSKGQGYDERFEKIEYADLKRGDLVCFDTVSDGDLCDHVGIYVGSGYFIHASSAAKKVILSTLSSGYYQRTFSWGRRIFED